MPLRQGDIYLYQTDDGGEIKINAGEPVMDAGLETAVYLSLFAHEGDTHWMNEYAKEYEEIDCQFYRFMKSVPKTAANIQTANNFAKQDLDWMISAGIADEIETVIESVAVNHANLIVKIQKDGETLFESAYSLNWKSQETNPASGRI